MRAIPQFLIKGVVVPTIALCSLLVVAKPSEADLINFTFRGQVSNVSNFSDLSDHINAGFGITGSMLVESATTSNLSPGTTDYSDKIKDLQLTLTDGSSTYQFGLPLVNPNVNVPNLISVSNDIPFDRLFVIAPAEGAPVGTLKVAAFDMTLAKNLGNAFNNQDLTTANLPPGLGSWTSTSWHLTLDNNAQVSGTLYGLSIAAVPLPPAVILFGAGLVALIGLGARNWQQKIRGLA